MQINRLFEMVYLLLHKESVTAGELAKYFEVSPRTIYRDVELLSSAGIPIYMTKGKGGGISLLPDFVLNKAIDWLQSRADAARGALLFVSDHGESLGEKGLYLHGLPQAIAPSEQTRVPMLWWLSEGFTSSFGLDRACLLDQTSKTLSHDNFFHSVLGMMGVKTKVYDRELDITAPCRK